MISLRCGDGGSLARRFQAGRSGGDREGFLTGFGVCGDLPPPTTLRVVPPPHKGEGDAEHKHLSCWNFQSGYPSPLWGGGTGRRPVGGGCGGPPMNPYTRSLPSTAHSPAVTPAKAGAQLSAGSGGELGIERRESWVPSCAGMTAGGGVPQARFAGYAFALKPLRGRDGRLRVVGRVSAGHAPVRPVACLGRGDGLPGADSFQG
jgi:hypothetical protein